MTGLQEIFRDVFDDENLVIDENFSVGGCWDSAAMVQIVFAVESEFGVKFSTSEIAKIKSVADILKKL